MISTNDTLHVPSRKSARGGALRRVSRDVLEVLARWRRAGTGRPHAGPATTTLPVEVDDDLGAWARATAGRNGFADGGID